VVAQQTEEPQDQLAGHGHDSDGGIFSGLQVEVEAAQLVVLADGVVGGFDQQEAQQAVALFGDVTKALGVATGAFFGVETAVGGDASRAIETRDGLESVDHREGSEQADRDGCARG